MVGIVMSPTRRITFCGFPARIHSCEEDRSAMRPPRTSHILLLMITLVMLVGVPADAQPPDRRPGERYALLVGVRQYYATDLRELDYAEADVTDLAQVFLDQGYQPENVVLMTLSKGAQSVRRLPMGNRIRHQLKLLLQGRKPDDSVIVALAGHGIKPRGSHTSYFCPIDADLDDTGSLIALDEIYRELEDCGAGFKLLLVDACRNDPKSKVTRSRDRVNLESITRPDLPAPPGGVVALFSCSAGEVSFEHQDLKHGVFFHYVIKGLRGGAVRPSDGCVTLPLLEDYVKDQVERFVRDRFDSRQMPERLGRESGSIVLAMPGRTRPAEPVIRSPGISCAPVPRIVLIVQDRSGLGITPGA